MGHPRLWTLGTTVELLYGVERAWTYSMCHARHRHHTAGVFFCRRRRHRQLAWSGLPPHQRSLRATPYLWPVQLRGRLRQPPSASHAVRARVISLLLLPPSRPAVRPPAPPPPNHLHTKLRNRISYWRALAR